MADIQYRHFTGPQVEHLRSIINVLLPFQTLLPGGVNYAQELGIVEFIDRLLTETERDEDLIARFAAVAEHPLAQCPVADGIGWRERRGLNAEAVFDAPRSENLLLEGDIKPFARAEFYAAHLAPLELAIAGVSPQTPEKWKEFVGLLLSDDPSRKTDWPHATLKKPSEFLYQLTRDALQAVLGLRNPYANPDTLEAVLIRLGEKRRVGNMFTAEDSEKTVKAFVDQLAKPAEQPVAADPVAADPGPVGSPPV